MRSALWVPLFDELADPLVVSRLAAEAEEVGWHGLFVWDHLAWRPRCGRSPIRGSASPPRRPPPSRCCSARWSRLSPADDRPSSPGRPRAWTGSAVAGSCSASAWAATGSAASSPPPATRSTTGAAAPCSTRRWPSSTQPGRGTGAPPRRALRRRRPHLPAPPRAPIPVWVAGFPGSARPLRRAATRDGYVPVNLEHPDQLAAAIAVCDLPDIVVARPAGTDFNAFADAGATWWLTDFEPEKLSLDEVRGVLRDGPT